MFEEFEMIVVCEMLVSAHVLLWGVASGERSNVDNVYGSRPLFDIILVRWLVCYVEGT